MAFPARVVTPFGGLREMFTAALILNGLKRSNFAKGMEFLQHLARHLEVNCVSENLEYWLIIFSVIP